MISFSQKGVSFIDVIVGTALVLIVFLGIFGAYQLGMKVVGQSKNNISATAIANQEIEKIRNLSYELIGIIGGELPTPTGVLETATSTTLNNVVYTIERKIEYISDGADGFGPADECDWDYKRAEIKVSWLGRFSGQVKLVTDVAPKDKVQEIASCEAQPGGLLSVKVFNAYGLMVESPLIEIFNPITGGLISSHTPINGEKDIPLATSTYKVIVSKSGFSNDRTYGTDEVAIPEKPHPIVLKGQVTEISFSIDRTSTFSVDALSPWGQDFFSDTFNDATKISDSSNIVVGGEEVKLASSTQGYDSSGFLISTNISPIDLLNWHEFVFTDSEPPDTDLNYQIYYATNTSWLLIPNTDLAGNSQGFDISPVDLSNLNPATYSQLKIKANLSTNTTSSTATLEDWQVSWITSVATPIPNATFNLRGGKIKGLDAQENPVYKYSQNHTSNSQGHINISGLEWDSYIFSIGPPSGLDLVSTEPTPQPIGLPPNTTLGADLYLEAENSLLVTVQNQETLEPIFSAAVNLSNAGLGYDTTQYTDERGQTYFIPLGQANFNLRIEAPGYLAASTQIWVLGDNTKTIKLEQVE